MERNRYKDGAIDETKAFPGTKSINYAWEQEHLYGRYAQSTVIVNTKL